jgi:hypothetical protein
MAAACMWFLFLYRSKNYGKSWEFLLHARKFWIIFFFPIHVRKKLDDMSHISIVSLVDISTKSGYTDASRGPEPGRLAMPSLSFCARPGRWGAAARFTKRLFSLFFNYIFQLKDLITEPISYLYF